MVALPLCRCLKKEGEEDVRMPNTKDECPCGLATRSRAGSRSRCALDRCAWNFEGSATARRAKTVLGMHATAGARTSLRSQHEREQPRRCGRRTSLVPPGYAPGVKRIFCLALTSAVPLGTARCASASRAEGGRSSVRSTVLEDGPHLRSATRYDAALRTAPGYLVQQT